ncbi:unnamed protein product [Anisakis simplex]|uniref:G_PROTEIN_RECEP_F1_2 domain-containing protein n=1 Tax=Anisakis simplex TaxID=6269 RepID=A0A0M3KAY7_ANISI|nr:unnamed protein product [Anisakis simplex]
MTSILNGPITATVVFTGVLLNSLTIYVLLKMPHRRRELRQREIDNAPSASPATTKPTVRSPKRLKSSLTLLRRSKSTTSSSNSYPVIYTYFIWLTSTDSALLVSALFMYSLPSLIDESFTNYYVRFFPFCYVLSNATLTASVWLMFVMMYDRYRALCRPLHQRLSQRHLQKPTRRIHWICMCILFMGLIYSLPRLFELDVITEVVNDEVHRNASSHYLSAHTEQLRVVQTALVKSYLYMVGYRIVGAILFYSLLPYVILSAISARVSYAVHQAALRRKAICKSSIDVSLERRSCESERILLATMAKFLISRLLPTALDITEHIIGHESFLISPTITIVVDVCDLIVVLASAVNFFIYCALSRTFRRSLGLLHCYVRVHSHITDLSFAYSTNNVFINEVLNTSFSGN